MAGRTKPAGRTSGGLAALPQTAVDLVKRTSHTARNVAEFVRFGGLETNEQESPFTVEAEQANYRLRRYFSDAVPDDATPVLLVPPLMMATEVWDVSPATSAVAHLHDAASTRGWSTSATRVTSRAGCSAT